MERFWAKVERTPSCWEWTAARHRSGYGVFGLKAGKQVMAHRFAYQEVVGPIPEGLDLDHLCRNRACVNPEHLEPVTRRENLRRGIGITAIHAAKTHCMRGHEFSKENTYMRSNGTRACTECRRLRDRGVV